MRIFLDANILFSASRSDGAIRALLRTLEARGHAMVVDAYVAEEARRNVSAKCPAASLDLLNALLSRTETNAMRAAASTRTTIDWLHPKDRPVMSAAIALKCDVLVTGDKTHFGAGFGKSFDGVRLCSPERLFQLV